MIIGVPSSQLGGFCLKANGELASLHSTIVNHLRVAYIPFSLTDGLVLPRRRTASRLRQASPGQAGHQAAASLTDQDQL